MPTREGKEIAKKEQGELLHPPPLRRGFASWKTFGKEMQRQAECEESAGVCGECVCIESHMDPAQGPAGQAWGKIGTRPQTIEGLEIYRPPGRPTKMHEGMRAKKG